MTQENKRFNFNSNETRYIADSFRGLNVDVTQGALSKNYLERSYRVLEFMLALYSQIYILRFDQFLPKDSYGWPPNIHSLILDSFKAKLKACLDRAGIAPEYAVVKFIRAKEQKTSENPHGHWALAINAQLVNPSNKQYIPLSEIYRCLEEAWVSTLDTESKKGNVVLGERHVSFNGLIKFPDNHEYFLDINDNNFLWNLTRVFYRISYFTKESTKLYGGDQWFRTSDLVDLPGDFSLEEVIALHRQCVWELPPDNFLYSDWSPEYRRGIEVGIASPIAKR